MSVGLVRRRPDPQDGRAFLLELTDDGRQRLDEVMRLRHDHWRERLDSWSTGEIAALADGLTRLAVALSEGREPPVA
jgi:DNA-binding MarR family transcriptional regulator